MKRHRAYLNADDGKTQHYMYIENGENKIMKLTGTCRNNKAKIGDEGELQYIYSPGKFGLWFFILDKEMN